MTATNAQSPLMTAIRTRQPKAVLFDLDGTLTNSDSENFLSLKAAWSLQSAELKQDWLSSRTGLSAFDMAQAWNADHGGSLDGHKIVADFIQESVQQAPTMRLFPDTFAALKDLLPLMPIGIVTNNFRPIVTALSAQHPALQRASVVVTADDAGMRPKPFPDLYSAAQLALDIPAQQCLAVEDSDQGLEAADRAGMLTLDIRKFR
ncbi:HAD-IA family hydrolase [Rhodobacteraceae bacterium M385]|nr:HAD-IA family hydrolase [Rhodobacteraceae bacterium M385]